LFKPCRFDNKLKLSSKSFPKKWIKLGIKLVKNGPKTGDTRKTQRKKTGEKTRDTIHIYPIFIPQGIE